jgi:hypothetical protein
MEQQLTILSQSFGQSVLLSEENTSLSESSENFTKVVIQTKKEVVSPFVNKKLK